MQEKSENSNHLSTMLILFITIPIFIYGVILAFGVANYLFASITEPEFSPEGKIYYMYNVEVLKSLELKPEELKNVYYFDAKYSKNLSIKLHFSKLKESASLFDDPRTEKLYKLYNGTSIEIFDMTDNHLVFSQIISEKERLQISGPSITMWLNNSAKSIKNHKYRLTIELPSKKDVDKSYNSFILVVGNMKEQTHL
jgi:hypothetical protein